MAGRNRHSWKRLSAGKTLKAVKDRTVRPLEPRVVYDPTRDRLKRREEEAAEGEGRRGSEA